MEGIKTIAYEIAEQLGWETPDAVVSPVASGTLFAKIAQGFVELADLGLVVDGPPRMYGAQPGGCPPVAAAWADERPPSRVTPNTVARSLAVGDPSYGELAIGAARMSGGSITALPEELIESSTELLAENSGVLADLGRRRRVRHARRAGPLRRDRVRASESSSSSAAAASGRAATIRTTRPARSRRTPTTS